MAETAKQSARTRGLGGKRVCRIAVSTTSEYDHKLTQISMATGGMNKSRIVDEILRIGLDSPNVIDYIQQAYGSQYEDFHFKAIKVNRNGKTEIIYQQK